MRPQVVVSQTIPSKTKQNCLVLLGFIRPNRDFSMGYGDSKQKNRLASQVVCKMSQTIFLSFLIGSGPARRQSYSVNGKTVAHIFVFRKSI
jgi:hypothetical protein